jgi:glycosidase
MRIFRLLICVCLTALLASAAVAQEIERVEPPFWWTGYEHRQLQLLVHGNNVSLLTPEIDFDGVSINRVVRVASPNYLFLYLDIGPDAVPGTFEIVFREGDYVLTRAYELRRRNPDYGRGFTSADTIYLITPDRFANGNPGNDEFDFLDDRLARNEPYGRHGGDLKGIADNLDYIAEMGFTSVWLNPVLENAMPVWSYHGYAITDFYAVDPRFGSNEQYRRLAEAMREHGLGLIMDQVLNHIGTGHWWMDDLPTHDWVNFRGEAVITNHRRSTNMDPNASAYDRSRFSGGAFSESMPDLNQQNPLLADYLVQYSIWWIEYAGLQGIRLDTLPYPDKHFTAEWARRIMQEFPDFSIVGEEWSESPVVVSYWQRGKQNSDGFAADLPQVFDFPLRAALTRALTGDPSYWDGVWVSLYEIVAMDFLYPDPQSLVIFPDNHDIDRIFTQLGEEYDLYKMALVFFATMRGIPQFFYGTEILASHPGTSSHGELRSDFPGGWAGDPVNAFTGEGLGADQLEAQAFVKKLLNWRKNADVIHDGAFMHFVPIRNVYVYFRYDAKTTIMVILNRDEESVTL